VPIEPLELERQAFELYERGRVRVSVENHDYREWLKAYFPNVATKPLAERHRLLWEWFSDLRIDHRPRPYVAAWPRGGGKSSTGELATTFLADRLTRKFVLYVCATQDQADLHVQSIATLLEERGAERQINKFGGVRAWRREQLRTASGFNVAGFGLDAGTRGIKIDQYRPDLIIFDDIDDTDDTGDTVLKKIRVITSKILPTGSSDCAILFLQNLIHEGGIVCQLVDGRADFLHTRIVPPIDPAVRDLKVEMVPQNDGAKVYKIVGGTPTWEGQDLQTCEDQINDWGLDAFKREAQHEVYGASGYVFDHTRFAECEESEVPTLTKIVRAWDFAATHGGGDYTVGVAMGISPNGRCFVLDVVRGQWDPAEVETRLDETAEADREKWGDSVSQQLPKDPGSAGKYQAWQLKKLLGDESTATKDVRGKKAKRARGWAAKVNSGNACLVRAPWNRLYKQEHREFREDEKHPYDDQVDASADAYNALAKGPVKFEKSETAMDQQASSNPQGAGSVDGQGRLRIGRGNGNSQTFNPFG
jgi:predicted phage terminase large subunit-like protein